MSSKEIIESENYESIENLMYRGLARARPSVFGQAFLNFLPILNAFLGFTWITFQNFSGRNFSRLPWKACTFSTGSLDGQISNPG